MKTLIILCSLLVLLVSGCTQEMLDDLLDFFTPQPALVAYCAGTPPALTGDDPSLLVVGGNPVTDRRSTLAWGREPIGEPNPTGALKCTASALGPRVAITAAHCGRRLWIDGPFGEVIPLLYKGEGPTGQVIDEVVRHPMYMRGQTVDDPRRFDYDISILHTTTDIPPPYITTFYDSANSASCTETMFHGWSVIGTQTTPCLGAGGAGGAPEFCLREATYGVYDESRFRILSTQIDPPGNVEGGDSGGPLYATVNGEIQLAGTNSARLGGSGMQAVKVIAHEAWIRYAIANIGSGLEMTSITGFPDIINVNNGPSTFPCDMVITASGVPVRSVTCEVYPPKGDSVIDPEHQPISCTVNGSSPTDTYSCNITIPQNAEPGIWTAKAHASNADGKTRLLWSEQWGTGVDPTYPTITVFSSTPDTDPPEMTNFNITPIQFYQDTGGVLTCDITATDVSGIKDVGCQWEPDLGEGLISCTGRPGPTCEARVDTGLPIGFWSLTAINARDTLGNFVSMTGAEVGALPGSPPTQFSMTGGPAP